MQYWQTWRRRINKKYRIIYKRGPSTVAAVFLGMALALWGIFALLSSYPIGLYLYYTVIPSTSEVLAASLRDTGRVSSDSQKQSVVPAVPTSMPVVDVNKDISLPEGHYLSIPAIGVDTILWEAPYGDYESALKRGVWRVPDFADPTQVGGGRPMILAAHRFGYLDWTQDFRLKNSFYELPKLKVGDKIQVIWDQHRYNYQVTRAAEGTKIDDYSDDLILYTCRFLVSPERYFVYAKLVL